MKRNRLFLLLATAGAFGPAHAAELRSSRCSLLVSEKRPGIEIISATRFPAGQFVAVPGQEIRVPRSCRIVGVVRSATGSEIGFELWLPDGWSGRYSQLGNGGFAGNIDHASLAAEIRRGNAAAMTDTGHKASQFEASWALGHPEKVIDYGYRSIKVTADTAKRLVADYYGRSAQRRYFIGCSNGGRQALIAAQRYPDEWDGIIAGSPAVRWTEQLAKFGTIQHHLLVNGENWIPAGKLSAIQRAAVAACGERSLTCRVDVRRLICRGGDGLGCLTRLQGATLDMIQSDPLGFDPRFAAVSQNWDQWILNPDRNAPSELAFATTAYRNLIHSDPRWQVEQFDQASDVSLASNRRLAGARLADVFNPDSPDLSLFARRGGKLIIYVGTADALISPGQSLDYYKAVVGRMGGVSRTARFARMFVVPGMQHCQGGPAPNAFGQAWVAPALRADPRYDIRLALEAWVERGRAPGSIIAASYRDPGKSKDAAVTRVIPAYSPKSRSEAANKLGNPIWVSALLGTGRSDSSVVPR